MNYSILSNALSALCLTVCIFCNTLHAQTPADTIQYSEFRFTVLDIHKKELTPEVISARIGDIFLTDSSNGSMQYAVAKIEYSIKDSCWILSQYDPLGYNYEIEIFRNSDTVNQRLLELRKMTINYTGYNMLTGEGCKFCICNDIPLQKGIFTIDVPKRAESWAFIRKFYVNVRNVPTEFRDISAIQNWMISLGK